VPDWTAFGAVTVTLTVLVLVLARVTQSALESTPPGPAEPDAANEGVVDEFEPEPPELDAGFQLESVSTAILYLNVAGTQALFGALLLAGIWFTDVPIRSLGVTAPPTAELAVGAALGVVLFGLNQAAARLGRQFGLGGNEALRAALAPETIPGWLALLFVVLPIVAGFEELLFRGALIGGLAAGFELPVVLLVVASSAVFALAHGTQGRVGVVVTGLLGLALAGAFVATGSVAVVVVAHYLSNALEFVVYEGVRG
jgi:membrane protease YdiL (CAAX protease family)